MARITGIGGIFIKARDPEALKAWYAKHLGLAIEAWGGLSFNNEDDPKGQTVWSVFKEDSTYFDPSKAPFMVNYRVDDLDGLIEKLRAEGCAVDDKVQKSEYGNFGWVMDPEGNRLELWQPPA